MRASRQQRIPDEFSNSKLQAAAPTKFAPTKLPPTTLLPTQLPPIHILTNKTLVTLNELVKSSTSTKTKKNDINLRVIELYVHAALLVQNICELCHCLPIGPSLLDSEAKQQRC